MVRKSILPGASPGRASSLSKVRALCCEPHGPVAQQTERHSAKVEARGASPRGSALSIFNGL